MEDSLLSCPLVSYVLVLGSGRPGTAALVLPRDAKTSIADLQPYVDNLNRDLPSQSRLQKGMIKILSPGDSFVLSPKGTVIRGKSEEKFHEIIEALPWFSENVKTK